LSATGKTGFTLLPPSATGISFSNILSDESAANNRIFENGSGVALGDVDGDSWCDIYFCRLEGPNMLYRNLGGWRFEDVPQAGGAACPDQFSTGAVFADIDGDGDLDLLVNAIGAGTRSFLNDGRGHFSEVTDTRLVRRFGSTSMALGDIDDDGDLDLYVANYSTTTYKDTKMKVEATLVNGKIVLDPPDRFVALGQRGAAAEIIEKGERDFLYLNLGQGRFAPVSWTNGNFFDEDGALLKEPDADWGLAVVFRDLNNDLRPDIYVCNDFFYWPDRIFLSEGTRQYRLMPRLAMRNVSMSSMAVDFADINRDGLDDFFVAEMLARDHPTRQRQRENVIKKEWDLPVHDPLFRPEVSRNTFFLNRGDGTYTEIACLSGLEASDWSWGAIFLDVDLDGYEDLLVPTGNNHDVQDADTLRELAKLREPHTPANRLKNIRKFPRLETPNLAFRNQRDLTFQEVSAAWGFDTVGISHGMALADLDNDGDLDAVINRLNAPAAIYRNESISPRLAVRLKGRAPNGHGIGAKIWVHGGAVPRQSQEMICAGRYLSCDDTVRVFAAGSLTNEMRLEVFWRSGAWSVVEGARANRLYEIDEADSKSKVRSPESKVPGGPLFQEVSELIAHRHQDEPFDDFARQSLLPKQLSVLGPGLAWFDVNGDGWEDLIIGSGRGGQLALALNDGKGGFRPMREPPVLQPVTRDQTTVLGWRQADGSVTLIAGSANYEDGLTAGSVARVYDLGLKTVRDTLPGSASSTGPIAMADVDGDGALDLFVGGRCVPGRYPEAASSFLFRQAGGQFTLDQANSKRLEKVGLVSGAVFTDLDDDGDPDLALVCEWGPLRVFRNEHGALTPWDWGITWSEASSILHPSPSTLNQLTGWWNGVASGDFDGDGRMDLLASNWGRNTKYQRYLRHPLRIYYGDFGLGSVEMLEAYFDPDVNKVVPWRDLKAVTKALPFVQEKFSTFRSYARAGIDEILGDRKTLAQELQTAVLDSVLLLNRGERWEAHSLPVEAQFAPAFGIAVGDADGDGHEDAFLSQNFFAVECETARYDAGRGLWLRGNGRAGFEAMDGQASGVKVYGQGRGAALADYDADGRVDLAVTQHGGATMLWRNIGGKAGLRVRLSGPPGNPAGVGAVMRLVFGDKKGPAREVHAGSGYWSQDGAVQVLGTPAPPTQIWVRWPGGKSFTLDLPRGAKEIEASSTGQVRQTR
jgi:hypothetical protein